MQNISFFAQGNPKGQPRPRAFAFHGKARVFDPGTAEGWKSCVAEAAKPHLPEKPIETPVKMWVRFYMPRPKKHFNKTGLRPDAPEFFTGKPDADNLAKAVMDALTILGMWRDDSLVYDLRAEKIYSNTPDGAWVSITY